VIEEEAQGIWELGDELVKAKASNILRVMGGGRIAKLNSVRKTIEERAAKKTEKEWQGRFEDLSRQL